MNVVPRPLAQTLDLRIEPSGPRMTPRPVGARFRETLDQGAGILLAGVEQAATLVPGGSAVSAAIRAGSGQPSSSAAPSAEAPAAPGAPGASQELLPGTQGAGMDAMEMIRLQQQISLEQRQFSTLSNVMKARHDTTKQVIGNIR